MAIHGDECDDDDDEDDDDLLICPAQWMDTNTA